MKLSEIVQHIARLSTKWGVERMHVDEGQHELNWLAASAASNMSRSTDGFGHVAIMKPELKNRYEKHEQISLMTPIRRY